MTTPRKKETRTTKYLPAVLLILLLLLVFLSGSLVSDRMLTVKDNTPTIAFEIDLDDVPGGGSDQAGDRDDGFTSPSLPQTDAGEGDTAGTSAQNSRPYSGAVSSGDSGTAAAGNASVSVPGQAGYYLPGFPGIPGHPSLQPGAAVGDGMGAWTSSTDVLIFKTEYDNINGDMTVRSLNGDNLIAPGTMQSYYFDIKNTGETSISYTVETDTELTATVGGVSYTVPLKAQFYNTDQEYLVGTAGTYDDMSNLDGILDEGVLFENHYTRYILNWQWPFEGDDQLDTLLGNLSAQGVNMTVSVNIRVVAVGYESGGRPASPAIPGTYVAGTDGLGAYGVGLYDTADSSVGGNGAGFGGTPQTGDNSNIALWLGLSICSMVGLILLLVTRRKETDEETDEET